MKMKTEIGDYLSVLATIAFLKERGIKVSRTTLFRMKEDLAYTKFGRNLYFSILGIKSYLSRNGNNLHKKESN